MAPEATPQHPKLTPEQMARVLHELAQEFELNNLRPQEKGGDAGA